MSSLDPHPFEVLLPPSPSPHGPEPIKQQPALGSSRFLVLSTPVGPLGSGIGGGVEMTLRNLVQCLTNRGHWVDVVAPAGSVPLGDTLYEIPRQPANHQPRPYSRTCPRHIHLPSDGVMAILWHHRPKSLKYKYDVLVNFA